MARVVILFLLIAGAGQPSWAAGYSGAEVYAQTCAMCHSPGVAGAPRLGQAEDWVTRRENRRAELLLSVLRGKGGMPPKGGNASLSVVEANSALEYMLGASTKR